MLIKHWKDSGFLVVRPTELVWALIDDKWTEAMWNGVEDKIGDSYTWYRFASSHPKIKGMLVAQRRKQR
jgi:hypothetical protein